MIYFRVCKTPEKTSAYNHDNTAAESRGARQNGSGLRSTMWDRWGFQIYRAYMYVRNIHRILSGNHSNSSSTELTLAAFETFNNYFNCYRHPELQVGENYTDLDPFSRTSFDISHVSDWSTNPKPTIYRNLYGNTGPVNTGKVKFTLFIGSTDFQIFSLRKTVKRRIK